MGNLRKFSFTSLGNWLYPCIFVSFGVMASLPFVVMRIAPTAAGFDMQWLPSGWLQWLGMLVLILLMFVAGGFAGTMTRYLNLWSHQPFYLPTFTSKRTREFARRLRP